MSILVTRTSERQGIYIYLLDASIARGASSTLMKTEPHPQFDTPSSLAAWLKKCATKSQTMPQTDDSLSDSPEAQESKVSSSGRRLQTGHKSPGACVHCKSLKVRYEFVPGEKVCQRCLTGNYECLPRTRKKRKPAPTHEDLQERSYNQDCQIQNLLLQFDKLRSETKIREWMGRNTMVKQDSKKIKDRILWDIRPEDAAISFFSLGHSSGILTPPDIVKYCDLYPEEIVTLFQIYFERINPFFSILDSELHTPSKLIWTSHFLFTVICATASRYYDSRPDLYPLATEFARDAAGKALINGSKSVDVCQAYLILSVYPVPKKRWAQDRSWLLQGAAITMALDLDLDQVPPSSCDERESLNRTRTWLNCFCVDHSHSIQFGKFRAIQNDYLAKKSREWYRSSSFNTPFDVHLCAYVQLIILMAEWRSVVGDGRLLRQKYREGFDVVAASLRTAGKLQEELDLWVGRYAEEYAYKPLLICAYRGNTTQMITAYLRLVVLAVGFQYAVKSGVSRDSEIFKQSVDAARSVIQITVERLYPTGHLRYAMEANFLYVSFAAAYLVNLLRPRFLPLLDEDTQEDIIYSVRRLIAVLGSKEVALDGRHTPALHSRFLTSLLAKCNVRPPRHQSDSPSDEIRIYPQYAENREQTPPNIYSWPDILNRDQSPRTPGGDTSTRIVYQQPGDADMDFSLLHFVRSVTQDIPAQHYLQSSVDGWEEGTWGGHVSNWSSF